MTRNFLLGAILGIAINTQAQYIISDPAFLAELQVVVPGALSGNVLDTTHASVLSLDHLDLASSGVMDLDGIRFFTGLDTLNVRNTPLSDLNDLPPQLKWLDCASTDLLALPNDLPDSLEFLDCSNIGLTSLPSTWPAGLRELLAGSNDLTVLSDLPPALEILYVNFNDIFLIVQLPSTLLVLDCQSNDLTGLPALPPGLVRLGAGVNQISVLPALPATLEELVMSYNDLTNLPALPPALRELYISSNSVVALPTLPNGLTKLSAGSNQLSALPNVPDSLNYLYIAWNQIDSLPPLPDGLTLLGCSGNLIPELPALPAQLEDLYCNQNPLTCLPALPAGLLSLVCNNTGITCLPNIPAGVTYTPSDLGFQPVLCGDGDPCALEQAVRGVVFLDLNGDGVQDPGEPPVPHAVVEVVPGPIMGGADVNGAFAIPVDTGTYSVDGQARLYHTITTSPFQVTIAPGETDTSSAIGYQSIPGIHDLRSDIQAGPARPGFENLVHLSVTNAGTDTSAAVIDLSIAADQSFDSATVMPAMQNGNMITWNAVLPPNAIWSCVVTLATDAAIPLGSSITHVLEAGPLAIDTVPQDNTVSWVSEVVGSYDPNDKLSPVSYLNTVEVQNAEWIDYTIRFQNTGTFLAENVLITDTLPASLQAATVQYVSASHNALWHLDGNVLTFSLPGILLPDSASDPLGSQGYVHFRIQVATNLISGDTIVNRANIFFDFNDPIITEPSTIPIAFPTHIGDAHTPAIGVQVAPNPAHDHAVLRFTECLTGPGDLLLYDELGRGAWRTPLSAGQCATTITTSDLVPGMYYFVVRSGNRHATGKLSVTH